jgi:hypothetical protein
MFSYIHLQVNMKRQMFVLLHSSKESPYSVFSIGPIRLLPHPPSYIATQTNTISVIICAVIVCVCVCLEYWWTWGAILYPSYADIACLEPTRNYTHHTKQYKLWSCCCCCCRAYYLYRLPFSIMIWPEAMRNIYTHIHREGRGSI